ncbi:MAG: hypothetical protein Fur0018_22540 [Anaerolineales bacterium]
MYHSKAISALQRKYLYRGLYLALIALSACAPQPALPDKTPPLPVQARASQTPVTRAPLVLTLGAWRTEDVLEMNAILERFHQAYPDIIVTYDPTSAPEYNQALLAQLTYGTGPDLFYLRSYATSQQLFSQGFIEPINDLPGLHENFTPQMLSA